MTPNAMPLPEVKPFQGPLPNATENPGEDEISFGEALERANAVRHMMETEGWRILAETVEDYMEQDQHQLAVGPIPEHRAQYDARKGRWDGLKKWHSIAAGIVRAGEEAKAELERRGA